MDFLKGDLEFLYDILNQRTYVKLRKVQMQKELNLLQKFIINKIKNESENIEEENIENTKLLQFSSSKSKNCLRYSLILNYRSRI